MKNNYTFFNLKSKTHALSGSSSFFKTFALALAMLVVGIGSSWGQVALITASNGGFENATSTAAANGWTAVGTSARTWRVGTYGGVATGTKAAYWGTTTAYGGSASAAVGHFYRDIVIPAGATNVFLNYKLKYPTVDSGWDYFYVFTTTTSNTPVNGTTPTTGYTNRFTNTASAYASFTAMPQVDLTALAGTTVRLVFTFKSDAVTPNAAPAVDDISLTFVCPTPTPTATAGAALTAICQSGTSAAMGGSTGGGATGATWSGGAGSWTNSTNASTATYTAGASESGSITLTLTATAPTGCTNATATKTITVNTPPTATAGAALTAICQSGTSAAMGGSTGGGATGATWSGGAGSWTNSTNATTATYTAGASESGSITLTLTATAPTGCTNATATKTITVNTPPTATAGAALTAICQSGTSAAMGGSTGGGATGATWSGGAGSWTNSTNASTATYTAGASESGSITLTLTATAPTGCTNATASKTITVNAIPAAPVITGPICPGNTTVSGTGTNGATIKVIRSGVEIQSGSATWSGTSWSITVSSVNAGESLTATQTISNCVSAASASYVVITPASWGNIQSPASPQSICGSTVTFYGQVYRAGTTPGAGQGASLTADLGWSSTNTNPNTWTNWTSATYNTESGNNDEFRADLGTGLTQGTWYYAYRYSYAGCPIYGAYNGVYNGTTNTNGTATVPASQTAALSSSVGTNAQTVCKGTAITNITYTLGNGANNATLTSGSLPTGVSGSVSGGVLTISGTPSASGVYTYTYATSGTSNCAFSFTGTITVSETLDFANLQFPSTAAICVGGNASIYGKVYESGVTEAAGAGSGITAQYGYSSTNSDPSGGSWTWGSASFNEQQISDDEFVGTFGSSLTAGTYYYTMRFTYNGCTIYGGFNAGPWNGTTNVNGTLTVNSLPAITGQPSTPSATCSGSGSQTMTVTATGTGLTYQWRKGGVNISNGGVFGGATTATLTLTNPTTLDAGSYDCVMSGTCSPSVTSNAVTVSVTAAPTAVAGTAVSTCSNSAAVSVVTGASATNNAGTAWSSTGTGTFSATNTVSSSSYTPSGDDITAGSVTLTLTATANGTCTNATSTKTLTINAAPSSPTASSNSRCGTGTVAISASSSGAVVDWYAGTSGGSVLTTGTPNPASGTNSFTTPSISTTTIYYAEARNATTGCLSTTRTAVTATVNATPAVTFTAQPGATGCSNTDLTYTTQAGQSNYVWTFPGTLNTDYTITSGGTSANNTVTLKYLTTGSKTVTVNYTSSGCSAVSATSSTATTIIAGPTVNAGADVSICSGQIVTLTGSPAAVSDTRNYYLTTSGGSYAAEKWVRITTGVNGTGTVVWAQGNGTIGNGAGLLTNQLINLLSYQGQTLYLNTYDQYDDGWDGTIYTLSYNGSTVINNGGVSPSDGADTDASTSWDASAAELETSQSFTVPSTNNISVSWSTGATTTSISPSPSSSTNYTYTATLQNGCSASDAVSVTVAGTAPSTPTASVSGSSTINVGGTATLTSSAGANTLWYTAASGGSSVGSGDNWQTPVQCVSGTITYYAEDNNGTCASTSRTAVSFTVRPMVVSNPANGLICQAGGSVTLSAQLTGGSSISWSPNTNLSTTSGGSTVASPTATIQYTMSATVAGCGSVSGTQTVGVIDAVAFTPTSTPTEVCAGNPAVLASNLSSSGFTSSSVTYSYSTAPVDATLLINNGAAVAGKPYTSTNTSYPLFDDAGWGSIAIPFTYNFFGENYNALNIGTNGIVHFGTYSASIINDFSFTSLPNAAEPLNIIAVAANDNDLTGAGNGTLRYWTEGIAPTRRFVIEWSGASQQFYTSNKTTAQVKLFETTGNVEVHVNSSTSTNTKVVGLQNNDNPPIGAQAFSNTTSMSNQAWKFVPGAAYTFQWATAGSPIQDATLTGYTTPNLSTAGTVSYSVAATNPNTQCTTTQSVSITVNALPSAPVSAGNVTECANAANQNLVVSVGSGETADWYAASSSGSVLASPSNGTGVTSYSVPANATATYYAQARNTTTGCVSSSRTGVTFTTKAVPTAPTASAVSYCQGATSSAMTASTPAGSNTQNWYDVSTGGTPLAGAPTPSTATATTLTYYVAEVGTNGCESSRTSVTATITASPAVPTGIPASRCGTGTVSLGVESSINGTIKWYSDAGLTNLLDSYANCTTPNPCTTNWTTPSISSTTVYYATKTNVAGCQSLGVAVTATVNPDITASVSNSASSTSACGGGSITFTATPTNGGASPTYQWYLNGATVGTNSTTYELASPANNDQIYVAMTPSAQTCLTSASATNSSTITLTSSASTPTVSIQSSAIAAICPGTSVTFSVNSSANMGATPSYVWKLNGQPILNATNATYTSTGMVNNDQITLEMTSSLNGLCVTQPSATSSAITTTVNTATSITSQPSATSACASGTANFTVTGAGQGTLTYQWKKNTVNITGNGTATSSSLTLSGVGAGDVADYTVVVTGACGSVTSNTAAFTINTPTAISAQPTAVTQCAGTTANFSVTGSGQGTLSYQWRKDGSALNSETNSTLAVTNIATINAGQYSVIVTGGCGNVTSSNALLTVNSGTSISTQPAASTLCAGNTANFSVTASGTGALSYQWKRDGTNVGTNSSSLAVSNAQSINAGSYTVDVTGTCGTVTSNNTLLTVNPLTTISTQPVATAGCEGQNTTFTVVAAGTGVLSYQWKFGGVNISGATAASFNIPSTTSADDGAYLVAVTGGCGIAVNSNTVALNVYLSPTTTATISTADITDATLCGKNSVSVVGNSPDIYSQGEWSVVGAFNIVVDDPGSTSATFTVQDNSLLGGATRKFVWAHVRTTSGNNCYTRDTITVDFKQPTISPISGVIQDGDMLWGGLTSSAWSTSNNWYQYTVSNGTGALIRLTTGEPISTTKVYTLSNDVSGSCVSSSNIPALGNGEAAANVNVGAGATLNLSSGSLTITSDLTNNGTINPGSGTITFNGTGAQKITGTGTVANFNNLVVNKASGTLTLEQPANVAGTLTMTQGDIITDVTNILEVGTNASSVGSVSWSAGTVRGPMKRWFAAGTNSSQASGIFPVGADVPGKGVTNRYTQINFTSAPAAGGYIIAKYIAQAPSLALSAPIWTSTQYIQNYEEEGYWDITPYNAAGQAYQAMNTTPYTLKLRLNNPSTLLPGVPPAGSNGNVIAEISRVRIISAKGPDHNSWVVAGNQGSNQSILSSGDYLLEEIGVTGFSWFNGGGDNETPLPVELVSFSGACDNGLVNLTWKTASEQNSSHFDIEKSNDGTTWRLISTVPSAENSTELLTYTLEDNTATNVFNYYRLRQVDKDGNEKLYDPILVSCEENGNFIKTLPNPSDASFQVVVNNNSLIGKATIKVIDTKGTVVSMKEIQVDEGTNLFYLNENMAPGIYYISISNGNVSTEVVKHSVK